MTIVLHERLSWRDVARVGEGEALALSAAARDRVARARQIVESIVESGVSYARFSAVKSA